MKEIEKRKYSRLKNLFFRLYERESELASIKEDEIIDIDKANYIDILKSEIEEIEYIIKQIYV